MKLYNIIRASIAAIALAMLLWANCNFFTAGTVIGNALFITVILIAALWKPFCGLLKKLWSKVFGKILLILLGSVTAFCAVCCTFFTVNILTHIERELENPEAVIVLGCQVRGEEPSLMLQRRLEAALEVLEEHPDALVVVSGGQGHGEDISEAEAMRRFLVGCGISPERIIIEDRSVSTRENIRFSAELLNERGISRAVIVTNEFHQYRAGIYAKRNGITAGHHSGKTPTYNLLNYTIREWAALFDALVRG